MDGDVLDSSGDECDSGGAREMRRKKRDDILKIAMDESLLDHSDDETSRVTRSKAKTIESEKSQETAEECIVQLSIQDRAEQEEPMNTESSPAESALGKEMTESPSPGSKSPPFVETRKIEIKKFKGQSPGLYPSGGPGGVKGNQAYPSGASGSSGDSYPCGESKLFGQNNDINRAYDAVVSFRKSSRSNLSLNEGGGKTIEQKTVGSFDVKDDHRSAIAHYRCMVDRKLNLSFSFDPKTLICSNCPARAGHSVLGGGGGGGGAKAGLFPFGPKLPPCGALHF